MDLLDNPDKRVTTWYTVLPQRRKVTMKAWEYRVLSIEDRILSRIRKDADTNCHIFTGSKNTDGYGQVKDKGVAVRTHRWMWERHHGPVPSGLQVLHKCDRPACVNIAHLYTGTHKRNMLDKKERGRSLGVPRGANHKRPMAKLSDEKVRAIKSALGAGVRQCDLADQYGVTRQIISDIKLEKTWRHISVGSG